ncbi:5665_t:CDS:2 [Cetraspora pellucida]|uniref:5665_t:CDS:1 n=1 Tax=Cetraspora pellucida TaxID=1433469 RepID=A0A9N9FGA5_9GLOM|nr:5665_t:CDS:2 [Cetraspora pellucida]
MSDGNQEDKSEDKSNDIVTVDTTETSSDMKTNAQMALMILKHQYERALELQEKVWKINFYTALLCIMGIVVGVVLLVLKVRLTDLNSVVSISVSLGSSLISGGGAIAAFRSFISSASNYGTGSVIEKEIKGPDFDNLAEPAALIVESGVMDEVYKNINNLRSNNNENTKLEAAQTVYAFIGCLALFAIAGYDFFNFVTGHSNEIYVEIVLIILGFIGLLYYKHCELKEIRFSRVEEERILYHLKGLKYDTKIHETDTKKINETDDTKIHKTDNNTVS